MSTAMKELSEQTPATQLHLTLPAPTDYLTTRGTMQSTDATLSIRVGIPTTPSEDESVRGRVNAALQGAADNIRSLLEALPDEATDAKLDIFPKGSAHMLHRKRTKPRTSYVSYELSVKRDNGTFVAFADHLHEFDTPAHQYVDRIDTLVRSLPSCIDAIRTALEEKLRTGNARPAANDGSIHAGG